MPGTRDDFLKYSDVHEMLSQHCECISTIATSRLVQEVFPLSVSRKSITSDHSTVIVGIRFISTLQDILRKLEQVKDENRADGRAVIYITSHDWSHCLVPLSITSQGLTWIQSCLTSNAQCLSCVASLRSMILITTSVMK